MPDESFPLQIGEEKYQLLFEYPDVENIEPPKGPLSLFVAFHPANMSYANAAIILWRGLRKEDPETGKLVHAIQQGPPGRTLALQKVREFCRQKPFTDTGGMIALYFSFNKALIASKWFGEPKADTTPDKPVKEPTEKN